MKSILLIGLGRFGRNVAEKLNELHHEVMAIDKNEERVNEVLPIVTDAQIGDATNEAFLRSLGVDNYDVCFVAIGEDFQSSLETTSLLKARMKWSIPKDSWRHGRRSATPRNTYWIISPWTANTPSMISPCPRSGAERPWAAWISAKSII